ncbi:MAG: ABC transporter ATP-binding protein [Planctomycetota bacterium]
MAASSDSISQSTTDSAGVDTASPAVSCLNLTKEFGRGDTRITAVDQVTLAIQPGEMSLLVGPSGCGKTTLISMIAGLLNPTAGEVSIFGQRLDQLRGCRLVAFRARNIGFVFQQYNLLPTLNAAENAAVPLLIAGEYRATAVNTARQVLESVGLAARAKAYPSQLSGGQQQRVAIARALIHQPRILVCDEPTAALDAQSGRNVMELLSRVAVDPQRAVIIVTHDSRVYQFGQRIITMSDGRIESIESSTKHLGAHS